MLGEAGEQTAPVGAAHGGFDVVLGMRHHAEHIAALVEDAGDRIGRTVDVPARINLALRRHVAIEHPPLGLESRHRLGVSNVVSLAVRGRHADHLPGIVATAERRVGALDTQERRRGR